MGRSKPNSRWVRSTLALLLGATVCAALVGSLALGAPLDHDEHQFISAGVLIARRGLAPYRDFAYFHTPYLAYLDAALFRALGRAPMLLLSARLLSAGFALGTVGLLALGAWTAWRAESAPRRRAAAALAAALLLANPGFCAAAGRAWNHDACEFCLLAAALLLLPAVKAGRYRPARVAAAGALLGLAVGIRLTAAPALAAFAGIILADVRCRWRTRAVGAGFLLGGLALALAPLALLARSAPGAFFFGNFQYPALNTAWRIARHSLTGSTTPLGKAGYFFSRVLFSSGDGLLVALAAALITRRRARVRAGAKFAPEPERTFLGLIALMLLAGSFAPAPLFLVYFYAPAPFLILWIAYAARLELAPVGDRTAGARASPASGLGCVAMLAAIGCLACGVGAYRRVAVLVHPRLWTGVRTHEAGAVLARSVREPGPALTLAPIYPLEGGLAIYPELAASPFALRVGPMLAPAERRAWRLVNEHDLFALCRQRPPAAVIVGPEGNAEAPLIAAAPAGTLVLRLDPRDPAMITRLRAPGPRAKRP